MKWKLVRDMTFHNNETKEYFTMQKDSVYEQVMGQQHSRQITRSLAHRKKLSTLNARFVILNAEGLQRVFEVGKDVVPHSRGMRRPVWSR